MCETPFCVFLLCFGGQNPRLVFNQRQLVEAIFASICVCTSVWDAAASLHRDSPLDWAQFLAKTETNSWHRVEQLFFFFSFDHMPESQEASELFVGVSHISALTSRCLLTVKLFVFDLFYWKGFLKDIQLRNKKAWLISEDVPTWKISEGLLLLSIDRRFTKFWQLKSCCHEARAVFCHKSWFWTVSRSQFKQKQRICHR